MVDTTNILQPPESFYESIHDLGLLLIGQSRQIEKGDIVLQLAVDLDHL